MAQNMATNLKQDLSPEQAFQLAGQLSSMDRLAEAEELYRKILTANPSFHPAMFQLALIAVRVGKIALAAELMAQTLLIAPENISYLISMCEICRRANRLDAALAAGQKATTLAPDNSDAWYNFGLALADATRRNDAISAYRRSLMMNPQNNLAANNLGAALEQQGDVVSAEKFYAQAVAVNPKHFEAQNNLGAVLCTRGDIEGAKTAFENSIAANPYFIHAHYNLSSLKKYTTDDAHLAALENIARQSTAGYTTDERIRLCFALGKAREDTGNYDNAFAAYALGNGLKRQQINYNEAALVRNTDAIIAGFDAKMAKGKKTAGSQDVTPIFVLGMPRSGTTLTEQILCSHPDVAGAGEVSHLADTVAEFTGGNAEADYTAWLAKADDAALKSLGDAYVSKLRALYPDAKYVTDKMPGNYYFIGLIHKVLPRAKIIHTPRAALDTCLSNFTRLFNETMPFAYDLAELGRYYSNYERLMEHWHKVLPEGRIFDIRYEDTVADVEGQTRRLLEHCGLPWDDACLAYYKNNRLVKTASIAQVRQPIYASSVERWKHFEKHLAPLRNALERKETATS